MEGLNTLTARRGQIKAIVTRFQNFTRSPECDLKQIPPLRQLKLEEAWQSFELVQTAIEELEISNNTNTERSQYRIDFENLFFETVAEAEQKKLALLGQTRMTPLSEVPIAERVLIRHLRL